MAIRFVMNAVVCCPNKSSGLVGQV